MENPEIMVFFITSKNGLPRFSIKFDETFETDEVLLSGFIAALIQFLSEVLSSKETHTQFGQADYDGLITEIGENYYCLVGRNIFVFNFGFYHQLFSFIEKQFSFGEVIDEETTNQISSLLTSALYTYSNPELVIPQKIGLPTTFKFWNDEVKLFYEHIDGESNLKEISYSTGLNLDYIFAFFVILQWLSFITFEIKVRDYLILEKTINPIIHNLEETNLIKEQISFESYQVYKVIDGQKSVSEIQKLFSTIDVIPHIEEMLRRDLIRTVSETTALGLLLADYYNYLVSEMKQYFSENKVFEICEQGIEISKVALLFPVRNKISSSSFEEIFVSLTAEGYNTKEIMKKLVRPIEIIQNLIKQEDNETSMKIFASVFNKLIEKHGFTLERMGLLAILCPEDYIS